MMRESFSADNTSTMGSNHMRTNLKNKTLHSTLSTFLSLKIQNSKTDWKWFIYTLMPHLLFLFISTFVPSLRNGELGEEYSSIIYSVINFPSALLVDMWGYYPSVGVVISIMLLVVLGVSLLLGSVWTVSYAIDYIRIVRIALWLYGTVLLILTPLFVNVLAGFYSCSSLINETTLEKLLYRYNEVFCSDSQNAVIVVLGLCTLITLFGLMIVFRLVVSDMNPIDQVSFCCAYPIELISMDIANFLAVFLLYSIPLEYKVISDSLNVALSLVLCGITFKFKTCYNRIDNSVLFAISGGRVGVSIGSLISSIIKENPFHLKVIGLPLTFGLPILFSIFCFVFMEFYQRLSIIYGRKLIVDGLNYHSDRRTTFSSIELNCQRIMQENNGKDYTSKLSFYFNQIHRLKNKHLIEDMTEREILLYASKILVNKNMRNEHFLYYMSVLLAYSNNNECTFSNIDKSIEILYQITSQSKNFVTIALSIYKALEIQEYKLSISSMKFPPIEVSDDGKMKQLKYNQDMLLSLHRDFWKELIEDTPQFSTIEKISNKISDLTIESNQMFEDLANHKRSKKILQMYASYVEFFHFDKARADCLNEEANRLEKESKGNQFLNRRPRKISQVSPELPNFETFDTSDQLSGCSCSENNDEEEMQKDLLFRTGIRNKPSEGLRNSLFVVLVLLFFGVGMGGVVFSIFIGDTIRTSVVNLDSACLTQEVGMSVIRNIRSMQSTINFIICKETEWKSEFDGYPTESLVEYINNYVNRMEKQRETLSNLIRLGQKGIFDPKTYTAYGASDHSAYIPTIGSNGFYSDKVQTRRVSVNEFVNNLKKFLDQIQENFPKNELLQLIENSIGMDKRVELRRSVLNSTYMNSIKDYNFMYYWSNIDNTFKILSSFCTNYVSLSKDATTESLFQYEIYLITGSLIVLPIAIMFILIVLYRQHYLKRFVKAIKMDIPRERIAKIYQSLCKQSSVDSSLDSNLVSKITKARYTLVISVIVLILINPFCLGMFYNEINNNAVSALKTYYKIQAGARVIYFVQICGYYLSEQLTFFGLGQIGSFQSTNIAHPFLRTADSFEALSERLLDQTNALSSNYTDLIFGNINIPYDTPLIGIYRSMDKTLKYGVSNNCSEYLKAHNLTYNVQTFYSYCIGVEYMMSEFVSTSSQVSELTKNFFQFQSSNYTKEEISNLFFKHYVVQARSYPLSLKLASIMEESARISSEISYVSLLLCTLVGGLCSVIFCKLILSIMNSHSDQYYHTKMLLNYVPIEIIDVNERLKNLVLYNQFSNPLSDKLAQKKENQTDIGQGSYSGVCSVVNSTVDGSVILNTEGEIELVNTPALKMLGLSTQEILGTSIYSIFEEGPTQDAIRKSLGALVNEFSGNESGGHDSLESECLRRNRSKFPTKINMFTVNVSGRGILTVFTIKDITSEKKQQALLREEKKHSENLLKNILPESVAHRLKKGDTFIAEALADVSVFFSDMVGFTKISSGMAPVDLVRMLNSVVNGFDDLTEVYQLEKIKTIGDAYFAVGGVGNSQSDHPERTLKFAMGTFEVIHNFNLRNPQTLINIRIGINTGSVVAGVIGTKKFAYDLWGDAVNTASRMESTSIAGRIQITRSTYERVHDLGFVFEERNIEVKGKGMTNCYMLNDKHHKKSIPTTEELKEFRENSESLREESRSRNNSQKGRSIIAEHEKSKQEIMLQSVVV